MFGSVPGGVASMVASLWVLVTMRGLDDRSRAPEGDNSVLLAHRYLDMLFVLSSLDLLDGAAYVLGPSVVESRGACVTQALLFQVAEPAIFVWVACMATELWFVLVASGGGAAPLTETLLPTGRHGQTLPAMERRHRIYAAVTVAVPGALLLVLLLGWGTGCLGYTQGDEEWCWVKAEYRMLQFFSYYQLLLLALACVVALYARIALFLVSSARVQGAGRRRRVLRLAAFPMLMLLTWGWEFAEHCYLWFDADPPQWLGEISSAATPLSGVCNALAYGLGNPRVVGVWRRVFSSRGAASAASRRSFVELRRSSGASASVSSSSSSSSRDEGWRVSDF